MPVTWLVIALAAVAVVTFAASISGHRGHGINLDQATEGDIPRLVMAGHKLDAIKLYRRLHGVDFKGAKDAIDRLQTTLPKPPKTS